MNVRFSDFVHEGERLYVCPVYDKMFGISKKHFQHFCSTWSNPGHRMNVCFSDFVHEGQRLYVCPVCDEMLEFKKTISSTSVLGLTQDIV